MKKIFSKWRGPAVLAVLAAGVLAATAAPTVTTLGGGPNQTSPNRSGKADGDTFTFAKFNKPYSVAIDTNGDLFIADYGNSKVRKVTKPGESDSLTGTFAAKLPGASGVAVDDSAFVYVVSQRDGKLRKFSPTGALLATVGGFRAPTAVALGATGTVFVAELGGGIYRVLPNGSTTLIASGLRRPHGLVALKNGLLAATESTGHSVLLINPTNGATILFAGGNGPGFLDGDGLSAKFNQPYGLALAPNGSLVVADYLNQRVRTIDTNGVVSTLFGVDKKLWFKPFPGWVDGAGGPSGGAAMRSPVGVAVDTNGTVYSTEIYWNLLRKTTDTGLSVSNGTIVITNLTSTNIFTALPAPIFAPSYGYFPFGVTVTVTSAAPVFYTTDDTEPTTNSASVAMNNNVGRIQFNESRRDLTSLRMKAFTAGGQSVSTGGTPAPHSEIAIPRDLIAGSGATIMVPVVANLRANDRVQSYQFRVEVSPLNGAPPVQPYFQPISIGTNEFIPVVTPASSAALVANYTARDYTRNDTRGLLISASGTNANVDFQNFAVATMLAVPLDPTAVEGQSYRIEVLYPSATSDGFQQDLPMQPGAARTITVSNISYLVGDVSPSAGYGASEFGDGDLKNNDDNPVLYASVGLRRPPEFTDVFNAMDAYPPEPGGSGDGIIDYLDWQVVLERSLRYDPANWTRHHLDGAGDIRVSAAATISSASAPVHKPKALVTKSSAAASGGVWSRGATLSAGNVYNLPSGVCDIPVSIKVASGQNVGGLCFRVLVESDDGAPAVSNVSFDASLGQDGFLSLPGAAQNDLVCAWSMVPSSPFTPLLQGSQVIGRLHFSIPPSAAPGHHYTIRFVNPSGASGSQTKVSFEGIPGSAWVLWNPNTPGQRTSDEWRVNFFGSYDAPAADDNADPDADGTPNWQEYLNGTDPTNP